MQQLVLIRHGESEGNASGTLAGTLDVPLTSNGRDQAVAAGNNIVNLGVTFDVAYSSALRRAKETLSLIAGQLPYQIPVTRESALLNERDFGSYTGHNKQELQSKLGDATFKEIMRSWNTPAPQGESLRDVQRRILPFFQESIMPELASDKNVLVVSHNQALRALIKHIEHIPDDQISTIFMENAQPIAYNYDSKSGTLTRSS